MVQVPKAFRVAVMLTADYYVWTSERREIVLLKTTQQFLCLSHPAFPRTFNIIMQHCPTKRSQSESTWSSDFLLQSSLGISKSSTISGTT